MATNIPEARKRLLELAARISAYEMSVARFCNPGNELSDIACEIDHIVDEMMTRKIKHNARTIAKKVTPQIVRDVLAIKAVRPELTYQEIGQRFGINAGRVSEIVNGIRTIEEPSGAYDGFNRKAS